MYKIFAGLAILFMAFFPWKQPRSVCECYEANQCVTVQSNWDEPSNAWADILASGAYDYPEGIAVTVQFMLVEDNGDVAVLTVSSDPNKLQSYYSINGEPSAFWSAPEIGDCVTVYPVNKWFIPTD